MINRGLAFCLMIVFVFLISSNLKQIDNSGKVTFDTLALKNKTDSIVYDGINRKAYPGCQVLIAVKGKIIFNKAYGYHTYQNLLPVKITDLYDIASLTKTAATTLAIMKLYEEGKIDIEQKLSFYLDFLKNTNKEHIKISEILAHQAGFQSWIPFYKKTLDSKTIYKNGIYSKYFSEQYPVKVADSLFIIKTYRDTILTRIIKSDTVKRKYLYSDMGFILLGELIKKISSLTLDQYVEENFYKPMNLKNICFNPLDKGISSNKIVPTEIDNEFRKQLLCGYVHDPAAAMLGGVAGNAGCFANAESLYYIMQMLINGGVYENKRLLKKETVYLFNSRRFKNNRRGLGFDKPLLIYNENSPAAASASPLSFGHSGFTGCYAWADPLYDIVYIFLSNRVYPDANNNKLLELNIRTKIQQEIYNSLAK